MDITMDFQWVKSLLVSLLLLMMNLTLAITVWGADFVQRPGLQKSLAPLMGNRDAVIVAGTNGRIQIALNVDKPLVPASILKVLTALAALENLGPDYQFTTEFYLDSRNNLKIKGYGDPLLVSERLQTIAENLAAKFQSVQSLILDDTYFAQPIVIPGRHNSEEPYDAPNGALCVNFNTVAFKRENGHWISDEPQTPLLASVLPKIKASGLQTGRITLAADTAEALNYTGELFHYFLTKAGVSLKGTIGKGTITPEKDILVWQYRSLDNLNQVVANLLEYSNNFIANQILLVMGAEAQGPPATIKKGLSVLNEFYHSDLGIKTGKIVEASGISRQNRMTARAMLKVLERFAPYRKLMRKQGRQRYKTGHLKGIRTRVGYLSGRDGETFRFAVILNTPGRTTHKIMKILELHLK